MKNTENKGKKWEIKVKPGQSLAIKKKKQCLSLTNEIS